MTDNTAISERYVSRTQDRHLRTAYEAAIADAYSLGEQLNVEDTFRQDLPQRLRTAYAGALKASQAYDLKQHKLTELGSFPYNFSLNLIENIRRVYKVEDLLEARKLNATNLDRVPGFGQVKAQQLLTALHNHGDAITAKTRVNLALAGSSKQVETLLRHLYLTRIYGNTQFTSPEVAQVSAFYDTHQPVEATSLQHLTTWTAMFAPRAARRQATRTAIAGFLTAEKALPLEKVRKLVQRESKVRQAHEKVALNTLWQDYRANAATYQAILAQITPEQQAQEALTGDFNGTGITENLWQRINNVELNLTGFKAFLRPYQAFGVKFGVHQRRVLLGDDMGLGKTIQALALITHLSNTDPNTHRLHLIVSPLSVQRNWLKEIAKHTGLRAVAIDSKRQVVAADTVDVIVTTYERLSDDTVAKVNGAIIVDEAHMAKNPGANRTQRILALVKNRTNVMFMTGTAMENRLAEMTRLIGFVNPFLAQKLADLGEAPSVQVYKEAIALAYLRRTKEDVLKELPPITVKDDWTVMGKQEQQAYVEALADGWHATRQASFRAPDSGKLVRIQEIINDARATGEKALIFSFYLHTLDAVADMLADVPIFRIDGSISPEKRQAIVDEFNAYEGTALFLSQIDTGGVGLNLQSASIVILCEPQLKYSTEVQAFARAHRMGQLNPVVVYRLITDGTVDEAIDDLRNQKAELFNEYANDTELGDRSVALEVPQANVNQILASQRKTYGVK